MTELGTYSYNGARNMVILHERRMQEFLTLWRLARSRDIALPECEDPDYESLDKLLLHILGAGAGYMIWMCECLELPDPGIDPTPTIEEVEEKADEYLAHLLERWRTPLRDVTEERFHRPEHPSRWKTLYCIDAMMEHAVLHPTRHSLQLEQLIEKADASGPEDQS